MQQREVTYIHKTQIKRKKYHRVTLDITPGVVSLKGRPRGLTSAQNQGNANLVTRVSTLVTHTNPRNKGIPKMSEIRVCVCVFRPTVFKTKKAMSL